MREIFNKIVKALKDIPIRATIHLSDDDRITIALGRDYFRKRNPDFKCSGTLEDLVEDRLKSIGIQKGYQLPRGVDIVADSSIIGDKKYTKAQYDINKGIK